MRALPPFHALILSARCTPYLARSTDLRIQSIDTDKRGALSSLNTDQWNSHEGARVDVMEAYNCWHKVTAVLSFRLTFKVSLWCFLLFYIFAEKESARSQIAWENSQHFGTPSLVFPAKWHLRNERRNSILMTRHFQHLGSASDWLKLCSIQSEALPRSW